MAAPGLALMRIAVGATGRGGEEHFLDAIRHQVYAGDTALHVAAAAYEPGFARELVEIGALVAAANRRGAEPLPQSLKYRFTGYHKFLDPDGYPAVAPPWGTLNAIDLNTGDYAWKIPLGEYPELAAQGQTNTGTENYGGPIVTAGGLLFIGATNFDRKFRPRCPHFSIS